MFYFDDSLHATCPVSVYSTVSCPAPTQCPVVFHCVLSEHAPTQGLETIGTRCKREFYLFQNTLVYCKKSYSMLFARGHLPSQTFTVENVPDSDVGVGFRLYSYCKNKWYHILMTGPFPHEEKELWLKVNTAWVFQSQCTKTGFFASTSLLCVFVTVKSIRPD